MTGIWFIWAAGPSAGPPWWWSRRPAVTAEGRITPGDLGIWKDEHIEPLARIARFVHSQGAVAGIQLAHAGRKASCDLPWKGGAGLKTPEAGRLAGRWPECYPICRDFADSHSVG